MKKPIDWAIRTVRNEAEDILGWAKQALYFCQKVVCLVDPHSKDDTYRLLQKHYPQITLLYQNRNLGDSDDNRKGSKGNLIAHANQEWAVNYFVQEGEWVFKGSPDERFDPARWEILANEIRYVRKLGLAEGIMFSTMHNFYPDEAHCLDYYSNIAEAHWGSYKYVLFFQKKGEWKKGGPAHSGFSMPKRMWWSMEAFYHYNWVKESRPAFGGWRDEMRFQALPRYELKNPIPNWRTLE